MTDNDRSPSGRDAARSREAILSAAETLFSERGYDAASLEEIGRMAGVSRGTPRYFFGAKHDLYRAVLARVLAAETELLMAAHARAIAAGGGPEQIVAALVDSFIDFLIVRPSFIRLVEREAAAGGTAFREVAAELPDVQAGITTLGSALAGPGFAGVGPAETMLSLLALCWFPLAHADTFSRGMGIDPGAPAFLPIWKRHVTSLVLHGVLRPSN